MNAMAVPYQTPSHGHSASLGGPPSKKIKGNPIITRYPPPPGYKPPVQLPPMNGYSLPAWQGQSLVQLGFPYTNLQTLSNASLHALPLSYAPTMDHSQLSHARSYSLSVSPLLDSDVLQGRHHSAPSIPAIILDGNGDPMSPPLESETQMDAIEHEYDEEAYFSRHPEQVDPSLSLGTILWKAPMPGKTALPSTFNEAELEAIAPRVVQKSDSASVSSMCNTEEALLSVRQTEAWFDIKDSLIFKEFPVVCQNLISLSELLHAYKRRFDEEWAAGPRSPTPGLTRAPTPVRTDSRASSCSRQGADFGKADSIHASIEKFDAFGTQLNVLDDLEAALKSGSRAGAVSHARAGSVAHSRSGSVQHSRAGSVAHSRAGSVAHSRAGSVAHSRAGSVAHSRAGSVSHSRPGSAHSHHRRQSSTTKFVKPKVLPAVRDPAQEDILAALGVSGSPKAVYQTPGPAFGPPPEPKKGRHSRDGSIVSTHSTTHIVIQDTIPEERDTPRRIQDHIMKDDTPRQLESGDDREPDDDATPRPLRWQKDNNRKRSYADIQGGPPRADDGTPKRSKPFHADHSAR